MLAAAGVRGEQAPTEEEITAWLHGVREVGYFHFSFTHADEAAAFVAAVSRQAVGNRLDPVELHVYRRERPSVMSGGAFLA